MITGFLVVLTVLSISGLFFYLAKYRALKNEKTVIADLSEAGVLASGLAHEIRNPLNSIKINIQLLQEDIEEQIEDENIRKEITDTIDSVTYEIGRLNGLMTNFLTYARPVELKRAPIGINRFLTELVEFLSNQAAEKSIALNLTPLDEDITLNIDEQKLRQSFLNIIINGIQILSENGNIDISLKKMRDILVIQIQDNGPGMTPEFMKEMFVAFSSQRRGGTGLGLSIANKMIEAHGGGIKVQSTIGKGTVFSIILPLQEESEEKTNELENSH